MFWRIALFFAWQLAGAGVAWLLAEPSIGTAAMLSGALVGSAIWLLLDSVRAVRALRWLRSDSPQGNQLKSGVWGELLERAQRLFRAKDRAMMDAESRLHEFLSALQASPNGVVLLDEQNRIEWCNQTAAGHFGLDLRRDMEQTIGNLVRDPGFAAYLTHRIFDHELLMPGRSNSISHPVRLSVQLHHYGAGRLLLLSRDITALEQAEAMRRDFVANVSHEIRTPLTVLSGFVETLQALKLNDQERSDYLALMAQQAERMQSLVNDLLMLSRLEGSPVPGLEACSSMPDLMQRLAQDAQALSSVIASDSQTRQDLRFDCQFQGELSGIGSELLSAMGNLVSNAVRYTPMGGRIDVTARLLPDGQLQFEVVDSGPGIAPEHLPRLTERFYRVDRSRSRETGGTGLGLAIVKHVAQRHGANLSIQSQLGHGAKFSLTFPASRVRLVSQGD